MNNTKQSRRVVTRVVRRLTGLPLPQAAAVARAFLRGTLWGSSNLPGVSEEWQGCGTPGCCDMSVTVIAGPRGTTTWLDLRDAVESYRRPAPTPRGTGRKLRPAAEPEGYDHAACMMAFLAR